MASEEKLRDITWMQRPGAKLRNRVAFFLVRAAELIAPGTVASIINAASRALIQEEAGT